MKTIKGNLATLVLAITVFTSGFAQTSRSDPNDVQGWTGAGLKLDLPGKWELNLDYEARFQDNLEKYKGSYFSISPERKLSRHFSAFAECRLALVDKGFYQRYSLGAEYKTKFSKLQIGLRGIIQDQVQDFKNPDKETDNGLYWRTRAKVQYPVLRKVDIYASAEPIMKVGGRYIVDNWRNQAGVKIKTFAVILDIFYIYRPDYAKSYNRQFNILGVNLNYTIKIKKRKRK